jgi:signal transduction histidine kinase
LAGGWRGILDDHRGELARACDPDGCEPGAAAALLDGLSADPPTARVEGILPFAGVPEPQLLRTVHRLRDALLEHLPTDSGDDRAEVRRRADALALDLLTERERRRETRARLTEAQAAAEAQVRRLRALGQLTAAVAHTFNNLLTVVAGYASALETSPRLDGLERRAIDRIIIAAEQATSMTEHLTRSARGDPPRVAEVQVLAFLLQSRDLLRTMVGRSIQLEVLAQQDMPRIHCDPARLHDAVLYLAANAREAMPSGGTLTLSAYAEPEGDAPRAVVIEVRDNGEGIAPAALPHVFEPGFTTRPRPDAAGLGCAQVRTLVEESGGTVEADSQPGDGATFRLRLPVA